MKRYIKNATNRGLNEEERDYLEAKIVEEVQKLYPDYDIDDIRRQGNRIRFGVYDDHGNLIAEHEWQYRPDFEDGPEEQLDDWLDDLRYYVEGER